MSRFCLRAFCNEVERTWSGLRTCFCCIRWMEECPTTVLDDDEDEDEDRDDDDDDDDDEEHDCKILRCKHEFSHAYPTIRPSIHPYIHASIRQTPTTYVNIHSTYAVIHSTYIDIYIYIDT